MDKNALKKGYKEFLDKSTSLKRSTQSSYTSFGLVREMIANLKRVDPNTFEVYDISDSAEFDKILKSLYIDPEFIKYDAQSNGQYHSALNYYSRYLKSLHSTQDDAPIESTQAQSSIHSHLDSYQVIYFGAPGTGKSYEVNSKLKKTRVAEENIFRTTFHPDSDYASFVGCYKPVMEGNEIKYEFTPQAFTDAYVQAWKNKAANQPVYLVIDEINRGNCAQIFGDLFQLLDRQNDGSSTYGIKADKDLAHYLEKELGQDHEGIKGRVLRLPPNLYIMATMNTSDQSLFPMDSAFKRRWDWEYVPIKYSEPVSGSFKITIDGKKYLWVNFLKKVNEKICEITSSEDKQMGNFFITRSVNEEEFKSKIMSYLWHEVCKDEYGTQGNFFRYMYMEGRTQKEKEFSFNSLYEGKGTEKLDGFMAYLGVSPLGQSSAPGNGEMPTQDSTTTRGTEEMQVSSPEVKVEEDQGSADPEEVIDEQRL